MPWPESSAAASNVRGESRSTARVLTSTPWGSIAVFSIVVCVPSVADGPQATSTASPPSFCGVSTSVATSWSPRASAATYAGSVLSGPFVSAVRSVCSAVRAGTAQTARARPATVTATTRSRGIVMAVSRATSAAPTRPTHARLSPDPGQISTGVPCAKVTVTPTARKAVTSPVMVTPSRVTPAPQRGATAAARASRAMGAISSGAHAATAGSSTPVHPARSAVGKPEASSRRPAASAATCGPAQARPGSANTAQMLPR